MRELTSSEDKELTVWWFMHLATILLIALAVCMMEQAVLYVAGTVGVINLVHFITRTYEYMDWDDTGSRCNKYSNEQASQR